MSHFWNGIPFRDEPGADTRRNLSNCTALERVEPDPVYLMLLGSDCNSNPQFPTIAKGRYTDFPFSALVASKSKSGTRNTMLQSPFCQSCSALRRLL